MVLVSVLLYLMPSDSHKKSPDMTARAYLIVWVNQTIKWKYKSKRQIQIQKNIDNKPII